MPAKVRREHAELVSQVRKHLVPHRVVPAESVKEQDGRTGADPSEVEIDRSAGSLRHEPRERGTLFTDDRNEGRSEPGLFSVAINTLERLLGAA